MKKGQIIKNIFLAAASTTPTNKLLDSMEYHATDKYTRYRIRKTILYLRRAGLVKVEKNQNGKFNIALTEAGKKKVTKYQIENLKIAPMKQWDKKWRMVIVNIPETHKKIRHNFYGALKGLGFHHMQRCVWIHPHECRVVVELVSFFFGIRPYVKIAEVVKLDDDQKIKAGFGL